MKSHQVIIVGGGPVGAALALDLGLRGVSCVVIERRVGLANIPKGQGLNARSLEHFHRWGLEDELRAARLMPPDFPIGEITAYGNLVSDYWHAPAGREVVRQYYFTRHERLPQYRTEMVLRRKLAALPNVEMRFGVTATAIAQSDNGVSATISDENGKTETLEADYLVGCDGGHSMVREACGLTRAGTDFDQLMALLVFRSREFHDRLKRFPERSTYRVMHPDLKGYWKFFGRVDVGEGFFFHAPVPAEAQRQDFDFRKLLFDAAGFEFAAEIDHAGFWELRNAVAETYRNGRVFIAGDAAHSHPPYGGFGLNNGLEDAVNLSWKLAARLAGWGGEALLASYSLERAPIFRDVAEDFIAARIRNDAAFLERYSPSRDRAAFEAAWQARETDVGSRLKVYEPNYEGSPVVFGPQGGRSSAHGIHSLTARAGHHLPPQVLSNGRNAFEQLGRGFTVLAFDAGADVFERTAKARGIPLKVVGDSSAAAREGYGAALILVRPDQYVAWTGDAALDADAIFKRTAGQS
jgi:2-polyprenyl-6-methoxyphenol hydroxylase-like FAD-dependent oxidoreductase